MKGPGDGFFKQGESTGSMQIQIEQQQIDAIAREIVFRFHQRFDHVQFREAFAEQLANHFLQPACDRRLVLDQEQTHQVTSESARSGASTMHTCQPSSTGADSNVQRPGKLSSKWAFHIAQPGAVLLFERRNLNPSGSPGHRRVQ